MSSQTPFLAPKSGIRVNDPRKAAAPLLSLASTTQRRSCFPIPASRSEIAGVGLNNPRKAVAPPLPMCPPSSASSQGIHRAGLPLSFQAQLPLRALRWPILSAWRWLVVLPGHGPLLSVDVAGSIVSRAQAANAGQIWLIVRYCPKPRQCFVRCCQHGAIAGAGAFCRPPPTRCSIQQEIRALSKARPRMPRPSTSPSAFSWVSGVYDKPTKLAWTLGYNSAASLSLRPWRATLLSCSAPAGGLLTAHLVGNPARAVAPH